MPVWTVHPNALGGWDVRTDLVGEPTFRTSVRADAECWAKAHAGSGDHVVVTDASGLTLTRFVQRAPASAPADDDRSPRQRVPQESPAEPPDMHAALGGGKATAAGTSLRQHIEREGGHWNSLLEWVLPLGAAAGASVVSPVVAEADGGWFAVFLATLTWSLGIAIATYVLVVNKLQGYEAAGAVAGSLLVALGIANVVSVGVLDVMPVLYETNGHPLLRIPAAFAIAALLTYGYLGTLVSGAIGVWLGVRFAKRFPI